MEKHVSGVKKVEAQIKNNVSPTRLVRNPRRIYSGVGYRARALAYSAGCFRAALLFRLLFVRESLVSNLTREQRVPQVFRVGADQNSLDLLLRPLEVLPDLSRVAHTVLEALARLREAGLRLLLQVHKLAVLGVHLS